MPIPLEPGLAIRLRNVSKRFILHKQKPFLMREVMHRLLGRTGKGEAFWALRDFSLEVREGESLALIGHNGAGKSTFLGLVAGTLCPNEGEVQVRGRLGTLLELGAGFHPDLTGRENVYLNASILGLQRDEVDERFDRIVAFSELGQFIDVSLRQYSSGMQVRLGFSVAVHVDPDILIMDEVLAVGDESFQHKCLDKIEEFKAGGKTLLFVSHGMSNVKRLCERVVWLDHGRVRAVGPAGEVVEQYIRASR
jgi:ABC-type polysaccharide/polyol phosphate transport system ATPase subunit